MDAWMDGTYCCCVWESRIHRGSLVVVVVVQMMENHQLWSVIVVVKVSGWVRHVEVCRDLVERNITTLMCSLGQVKVS